MSGAPDALEFIAALAPALRQAAAIAHALEGRVPNRPKVQEATEVKQALTLADTASQEAILVPLLENFPDVALEAEEDTPTVARFSGSREVRVVIDPIDGTFHFYLGARGPYAVMVGLAVGERYDAAMVALPREGLFFSAARGRGAQRARAGGVERPASVQSSGDRVIVSHDMPRPVCEHLEAAGMEVRQGCGGAVSVAPLIPGVRAGLRYAPSPGGVSSRGRIGAMISAEAGARVCIPGGRPFPEELGVEAPILCCASGEAELRVLDEALAAAGLC